MLLLRVSQINFYRFGKDVKLYSMLILSAVLSGAVSWYFTGMYYQNMRENAAEDIVSSEFRLLESVKDMKPPCESLADHSRWIVTQDANYVVIWRLPPQSTVIEKFVVNKDFESAFDQVDNTCPTK